jgi:hypothetical protein
LQRNGEIGLGQDNRVALFPLGQLQALVQLLLEHAIAYLIEDVGVSRFVGLEGFVEVEQMILYIEMGPVLVSWAAIKYPASTFRSITHCFIYIFSKMLGHPDLFHQIPSK